MKPTTHPCAWGSGEARKSAVAKEHHRQTDFSCGYFTCHVFSQMCYNLKMLLIEIQVKKTQRNVYIFVWRQSAVDGSILHHSGRASEVRCDGLQGLTEWGYLPLLLNGAMNNSQFLICWCGGHLCLFKPNPSFLTPKTKNREELEHTYLFWEKYHFLIFL